MFIQMRKWIVTEGNSDKVLEKLKARQGKGLIESREGFIGREILVKNTRRGDEEVIMMVRWESQEAWKAWEKSPEHIAGHREKMKEGKPPQPEYIISMEHASYTVID